MKVLLVHNYYQSSAPSGEDTVFKNEVELLKDYKVEVVTYTRHNDEIINYGLLDKLKLPFKNIWSGETYRELKDLISREKPDIAHFHNIFYLISPSAYYVCKDIGVPVIQSLHNFRFFCINGLLLRDGKVCEKCVGRLPLRGALAMCYKDSRLYSIPLVFMISYHHANRTWDKAVDCYIASTKFTREIFIEAGLQANKIFVKPNFLMDPLDSAFTSDGYMVFIGRLSEEKGLRTLFKALHSLKSYDKPIKTQIIGDGPLRQELEKKVKTEDVNGVEFVGRISVNDRNDRLRKSNFMILPSICYESFPMTIGEAFACGKPVIASRLGAMAELIEDGKTGLLFKPGDFRDLASKVVWMFENCDACIEMGKNARAVFEEKYVADKNFETLMEIYESILGR